MEIIRTQNLAISGKPATQQQQSPAEQGSQQVHDGRRGAQGRDGAAFRADSPEPLRYVRTEKMALHLKTQEGDDVKLRFRSRETGGSEAGVQASGEGDGEGITLEPSNKTKVALKVDGNLNADEFSAIRDAFDQVAKLAEQFFSGGIQSAFESAESLSINADQLISFEFRARIEDRVTYAAASFTSSPAVQPEVEPQVVPAGELLHSQGGHDQPAAAVQGGHDQAVVHPAVQGGHDQPAVQSAHDQPAAVAEAPVEGAVGGSEGGPIGLTITDDPIMVLDPAAEGSEQSASVEAEGDTEAQVLDPAKLIGRFLGQLRDGLMGGFSQQSGVMDFSVKIRMFQETISTIAGSDTNEGSGLPKLVPETLEAIASKEEQGPLDKQA